MTYNHIGEYDGYVLPELLKEETPETRAKRKEALAKLDALIANGDKYLADEIAKQS